jgi:amino acid adenylation domain-containing protein
VSDLTGTGAGSIPRRFEAQVSARADQLAVRDGLGSWTYAALEASADRVAGALLADRAKAPRRVGLLFPQSALALAAHLGVWKAGATCVPLDPSFPRARLEHIARDAQLDVVVSDASNATLAGELGPFPTLDAEAASGAVPDAARGRDTEPDAIAALFYTSGSTGKPKGVVQNHRNLLHRVWSDTRFLGIGPSDRQSLLFALSFGAALPDALDALLNGASLHLYDLRRHGLEGLSAWLAEEAVTIFHPPVSAFRELLAMLPSRARFPACRIVVQGGEPLLARDVERFREHFDASCLLVSQLASTEANVIARFRVGPDTILRGHVVPVGEPVEDKEILILDESGQSLPAGETGEITVRSAYLSPGYWRRSDLTEAAFPPEEGGRLYKTGDLGRLGPDGILEHLGRRDLMVKIRGYRVDLTEVEDALLGAPGVRAAVAIALDDDVGRRRLVAYVVSTAPQDAALSTLRLALSARLPDYMLPSRFVFLDELPRTPTGKIDRRALPEPSRERPHLGDERRLPDTELERQCLDLWGDVLGIDGIGVDDDFFDLGGDSLTAVRLLARLGERVGRELSLPLLLQARTVAELCRALEETGQTISSFALGPVHEASGRHPIFCLYGFYIYRHLAEQLGPDLGTYGIYVEDEVAILKEGQLSAPASDTAEKLATLYRRAFSSVEGLAERYLGEIRRIQPAGPYHLLGHSFGGLVALEVARELHRLGEPVAFLALLDSYAPGARSAVSLRAWVRHLRKNLGLRAAKAVTGRRRPRLRKSSATSNQGLDLSLFRTALRRDAAGRYEPRPYPFDALLVRAAERNPLAWYEVEPLMGWDRVIQGRLDVCEVPGDHLGILDSAHAPGLADALREHLRRGRTSDPRAPSPTGAD